MLPKDKILEILGASEVVTEKQNVKFLLKQTLSARKFNTLKQKIDPDNYNPSDVLQEWFVSWKSYQGRNATLENLAEILQNMDCNGEAGKQRI